MDSIGSLFKTTREQSGVSIEEASSDLNINVNFLLNIEEGKMERITEEIIGKYNTEEKEVFPGEKLDKLQIPEKFFSSINYTVKRKDIDINKHMHNLYYLDLAYEALPEEVYNNERPFNNVRIMYKTEIKLGDTVVCKYTKKDNRHIVVIKDENEKRLHSIIELY